MGLPGITCRCVLRGTKSTEELEDPALKCTPSTFNWLFFDSLVVEMWTLKAQRWRREDV